MCSNIQQCFRKQIKKEDAVNDAFNDQSHYLKHMILLSNESAAEVQRWRSSSRWCFSEHFLHQAPHTLAKLLCLDMQQKKNKR